ncbi:MAG: class I SAM-dependent methyltransferase [Alphaproteobacteria bacterium]|nr:class I SAM-dependent methyltransferase [Alphaproteobacteria bacterium]
MEIADLPTGTGGGVDGLEDLRRDNFERIWKVLDGTGDLSGQRLLEIGCARGFFLDGARKRGLSVVGIEPDAYGDEAKRKGHEVLTGLFPAVTASFPDRSFDIVAFNDVFEHVPDPRNALHECNRLLTPGGKLLINLPMSDGIFYRTARIMKVLGWNKPYERLWQKGFSSPHVYYFSEHSLKTLIKNTIGYRTLHSGRLRTTSLSRLRQRLRSVSVNRVSTAALYIGSVVLTLGEGVFPADIKVFIFEKPQ